MKKKRKKNLSQLMRQVRKNPLVKIQRILILKSMISEMKRHKQNNLKDQQTKKPRLVKKEVKSLN